jgi:predicted  nucleic acid-binding Zn-ribbon protein
MKYAWLSIALLTVAACDGGKTQKINDLTAQVAQLQATSAAKDSAVQEVAELTQLLGEINTEIATVKVKNPSSTPVVGGESPSKAQERERQNVVDRVKALADAVKSGEARLASARTRINALSKDNESMKSTVTSLQASLDNLNQVVETQKTQIAQLTVQVDSVKGENAKMVATNAELTDTLKAVSDRANMVYYAAGTRDDLLKKGLVTEEGGARFLFIFPRTGKSLVPARTLPVEQFQSADARQMASVTLPNPDKYYKLVSRQDPSLLTADSTSKGAFKGHITISDPTKFWSASRYLILVEQD